MEMLRELLAKHPGRILGVILGLFFGWLAIKYGLWKALFVTLCAVAGYYLGKQLDNQAGLRERVSRFFRER